VPHFTPQTEIRPCAGEKKLGISSKFHMTFNDGINIRMAIRQNGLSDLQTIIEVVLT
jgi:hypothetical protein